MGERGVYFVCVARLNDKVVVASYARKSKVDSSGVHDMLEQPSLKGMLPADVVAAARGVCERIVDGLARKLVAEGKAASALEGEPFETRLARLFESHPEDAPRIFREELHAEGMKRLFFDSQLLDVVERILGTPEIRLYPNYAVYPKMPAPRRTQGRGLRLLLAGLPREWPRREQRSRGKRPLRSG